MHAGEPLEIFNVLIADDERPIQSLVHSILQSVGFRKISIANSGIALLAQASAKKFDFIITDWRMDELDGVDAVTRLRQNPHGLNYKTPVIMLTGNTEAFYVKAAIIAGIDAYLIKPFSAAQLLKRVRKVIEAPQDFVICRSYSGPNRRRVTFPPPQSVDRRRSSVKK